MQQLNLLLSPSELAAVRGTNVHDIITLILERSLPYLETPDGIKVPVSYTWDETM